MGTLTNTHNLCFEQIYKKYQSFSSEHFQFLEVKFSVNLNRRVFVMFSSFKRLQSPVAKCYVTCGHIIFMAWCYLLNNSDVI